MQYEVIGIGSGFFAHILTALVASWRRMLRMATLAAGLSFLSAEAIALWATQQFPPSNLTHIVAGTLALALAYGVASTVFANELIHGALRALRVLQEVANAHTAAEVDQAIPALAATAAENALPTPLPQSARAFAASLPNAAHAQVEAPVAASRQIVESVESAENEPTQPITVYEEDSASVTLLPSTPVYDPAAAPGGALAYPSLYPPAPIVSAPLGMAISDVGISPAPPAAHGRYDAPQRVAPPAHMLGALLPPLVPLAAGVTMAEDVALAAPAASRRRWSPFARR